MSLLLQIELSDFTMIETKLAVLKVNSGLVEILNTIRVRWIHIESTEVYFYRYSVSGDFNFLKITQIYSVFILIFVYIYKDMSADERPDAGLLGGLFQLLFYGAVPWMQTAFSCIVNKSIDFDSWFWFVCLSDFCLISPSLRFILSNVH